MNAPGFRYRSFGNEPVRIRPGAAGTLAAAMVEPLAPLAPLPGPGYLEEPAPELPPLLPMADQMLSSYGQLPAPELPAAGYAEPAADYGLGETAPQPMLAPPMLHQAMPEPMPEPEPPAAPLFSWPEAPMPAPSPAPSLLPEVAQAYPAAMPEPAEPIALRPVAADGFRLLQAIGHRGGGDEGMPRPPGDAGGTLAMLRSAMASGTGDTTMAGISAGMGGLAAPPGLAAPIGAGATSQGGLLPAAAVTVPLSDVMRLIAAGATPPTSPFDAFRVALGAQPGR